MPDDFVTVATFVYRAEADLCLTLLEQDGIPAMLADEHIVGFYNFFLSNAVGGIKLQVAPADAERARRLLDELEARRKAERPEPRTAADYVGFNCDWCGERLRFPNSDRGSVQTCSHCGEYVDVPEDGQED